MSAEAERVFSSAGFVLNSRRRRLREETLEAMLCLTHRSKLGSSTSSEGLWGASDEGEYIERAWNLLSIYSIALLRYLSKQFESLTN
jgi:hypothetical protein